MERNQHVVIKPLKIDLHIHSAASSHKDGNKVKDGTIENIDTLFRKLEENEVNMAAITDHDTFDYATYTALKSKTSKAKHLLKVLPGVEFTVSFETKTGEKPVHIVTIFDDSKVDEEQIKSISDAIPSSNGKPQYDKNNSFSENEFWNIIRKIGLDVVLIAHQKATPGAKNPRKNDANSVGNELYNEFLFLEYFEAYEYKNRRNELFNKSYAYSQEQLEQIRFITGSDCHVWTEYPAYDALSDHDLPYTYLKCLPTFRGLAMAVTDISRIKTIPSFFSGSQDTLNSLELSLNGVDLSIPLSPGINAIIGDNSIGKSSLLNALTDFHEVGSTVKKGQEKYLKDSKLALRETLPQSQIMQFDGQDAIRKSFEGLSEGKAKKRLEKHFLDPVDPAPYKNYAIAQFQKFLLALTQSCKYQEALDSLVQFVIPEQLALEKPQSITFDNEIKLEDQSPHNGLISEIKNILVQIESARSLREGIILNKDKTDFDIATKALKQIQDRHQLLVNQMTLQAKIANKVEEVVTSCKNEQTRIVTDAQKAQSKYLQSINQIGTNIANTVACERNVKEFSFSFSPMGITPRVNPVGDLHFICKLGVKSITPSFISKLVDSLIGKSKHLDTRTSSYDSVRDAIKNYPEDEDEPLKVLSEKFETALDAKLKPVKAINREGDDVFDELSRGYNAQMYFALMADKNMGDGIYIVDQPEDQISQKAIKESVLGGFRSISDTRQVILITHNPQFIINLDVDNVIFLGKENDTLFIRSGALEYECSEFSILETVADNIEGGLETIQKRMKRYEKAN